MAKVYLQQLDQKGLSNGYASLDPTGHIPVSQMPVDYVGGGGGTGNARVLLWDDVLLDYMPAAYRSDTSNPREFIGPIDPTTVPTITGPVFGDRWTPTEAPLGP